MNQIFEKVLADYKKANKVSKQRMIEKYGFKTEKAFFKFLNGEAQEGKEPEKLVDYVIAFDTTGSMRSYIGAVKEHVKELIPKLFKETPNLNLEVIAFGDYCDMDNAKTFGKALQRSSLTANENDLIKFVQEAKNTSGGDGDEFYELIIDKINKETKWREGSEKVVLFIGDADPHKVGYKFPQFGITNQIDWKVAAADAAKLGIQYDTLKIQPHCNWYETLSAITNGVSIDFKSAAKVGQIIEAANYVRNNKVLFSSMVSSATLDGDMELVGAYKSLSSKL